MDVESRTRNWFEEVKGTLNVKSECAMGLCADVFWLADAVDILEHQFGIIARFKESVDEDRFDCRQN